MVEWSARTACILITAGWLGLLASAAEPVPEPSGIPPNSPNGLLDPGPPELLNVDIIV